MAAARKRLTRPRRYRSELRQQLKADVRDRIVKALVDLVVDEGATAFTMQNVARRADVSLRTVYRHFESREQLLEALADHSDAAVERLGLRIPENVEEGVALMPLVYEKYFASIRKELQAAVIASIATGYRTKSHVARWGYMRDLVAKSFPHLTTQDLAEAAALITVLTSSRVWFVMTAEYKLDDARAGRAAEWGVRAFLDALKKRNDSARRSKG